MNSAARLWHCFAGHAVYVLAVGLLAGLAFPSFAHALRPGLSVFVTLLLYVAALRLDGAALPRLAGRLADISLAVPAVPAVQLCLRLALLVAGCLAAGAILFTGWGRRIAFSAGFAGANCNMALIMAVLRATRIPICFCISRSRSCRSI